jgi:hypothetical protein
MSVRGFDSRDNFTVNSAALAQTAGAQLQSLAALIPPPQRQQFSKKLFGGDAAAFEKLLAGLETAPNWRIAHRLMEQYFYQRQINPYHHQATRFSDLVYKRYFPLG